MGGMEMQAVVLAAGRGTRMPELIGENSKCLLPVGPYPLLWYPLQMLQYHGFLDVIVVVLESQRFDIQQAIEKTPLKLKIDFASIPTDSDFGTVDSLKHIYEKIKTDFIVVSCDVITNVSLYKLINKFRQHNASVTALFFKSLESSTSVPGSKTKYKPERDLVGLHPKTKRLLFLASTSDFEDALLLKGHLLRKNEEIDIYSHLVDSHIYVIRKWVLDFLMKRNNFTTLKGEFLPYLVKKQMCKVVQSTLEMHSEYAVKLKPDDDIFDLHSSHQIESASLFTDSLVRQVYNGDLIRCYAENAGKDCFGIRVNTLNSYFTINQQIATVWPKFSGTGSSSLVSANALVNSTQIRDIAVGENAKLSAKTSLMRSTFGPYCCIKEKVIISNSVIMGHVIIEEGSKIENCIICGKAIVKRGSILKNCLVGPNFVVEEESRKQMVHLTNADGFMEIE